MGLRVGFAGGGVKVVRAVKSFHGFDFPPTFFFLLFFQMNLPFLDCFVSSFLVFFPFLCAACVTLALLYFFATFPSDSLHYARTFAPPVGSTASQCCQVGRRTTCGNFALLLFFFLPLFLKWRFTLNDIWPWKRNEDLETTNLARIKPARVYECDVLHRVGNRK